MDGFQSYVLTVTTAAILGALVMSLAPWGKGEKRLLKMICGLFMLLVVCSPLTYLNNPMEYQFTEDFRKEAESVEAEAMRQVQKEMEKDIKRELQAYIEDKALALGAEVAVQVRLSPELTPWEAHLQGKAAPYARSKLTELLEKELGIPKERQVWSEP